MVPGLGFNGLIGFSPIAMMKNSLGTSIAVDKYGSSFFKNGAQPSGVLEHPGVLKDPNRVRDNWEAAYGGAANAHRVAVLEEGMAYKPISPATGGQPVFGNEAVFRDRDLPHLPCASASGSRFVQGDLLQH